MNCDSSLLILPSPHPFRGVLSDLKRAQLARKVLGLSFSERRLWRFFHSEAYRAQILSHLSICDKCQLALQRVIDMLRGESDQETMEMLKIMQMFEENICVEMDLLSTKYLHLASQSTPEQAMRELGIHQHVDRCPVCRERYAQITEQGQRLVQVAAPVLKRLFQKQVVIPSQRVLTRSYEVVGRLLAIAELLENVACANRTWLITTMDRLSPAQVLGGIIALMSMPVFVTGANVSAYSGGVAGGLALASITIFFLGVVIASP